MEKQKAHLQPCPAKSSFTAADQNVLPARLIEKSVIIHKDEDGFGLRIKGQSPVFIEHVHENGAAWRAGVRPLDLINKVNGVSVGHMDHRNVVLAFKSCSRFVALTLISPDQSSQPQRDHLSLMEHSLLSGWHSRQPSPYSQRVRQFFNRPEPPSLSAADQRRLSTTTNYSIISTPSSAVPMIDRTNSCRVTTTTSAIPATGNQISREHQPAMLATASFGNRSDPRQVACLSRQGSIVEQDGRSSGDKRFAVCICCRSSIDGQQQRDLMSTCAQCQLNYCQQNDKPSNIVATQTRQLHASLRDARSPSGRTSLGRVFAARQQQPLAIATGASSAITSSNQIAPEPSRQLQTHAGSIVNKLTQSMSTSSLSALELHNNNLRMALINKPLLSNRKDGSTAQPLPQPPSSQQPASNKRPVVNRRIEIIREFINTERTHTERLRCLNELFYRPLKQAGFMSVEQLRMVFSCHRSLYKIHRQIYHILMSANYDAYSEPLIGSALLEIFEGDLKRRLERASCTFCSAQATNIELLNKLTRRDTKVGEFLAQITSQRMVGRLGIKDLLASCFQRLTKYPLLLESLLKATPLELPDDPECDEAVYGVDGSCQSRPAAARRTTASLSCEVSKGSPTLRPGHHHQPRLGNQTINDDIEGEREQEDDQEKAEDKGEGENGYDGGDSDKEIDYDVAVANNGGGARGELDTEEEDELRLARLGAAEEARRHSRRIMAISLAEECEFIERALRQSRQILVRVNDSIKVAMARNRLKEIWKRTDKYPDVPLSSIDISKQQLLHEGVLTLRLSKRSFDVYVLLLNDYIIILAREGQDKYRLKFFTPDGKSALFQTSSVATAASSSPSMSSSVANIMGTSTGGTGLGVGTNNSATTHNLTSLHQTVYSPIFVIDEHLTTRDAATDENGFYLLCKCKDDSRIYEFASRSPAERLKWRDKIQTAIERQMSRSNRRPSNASTITKSSSEISVIEAPHAATGSIRRGTVDSNDARSSIATNNLGRVGSSPNSCKGRQQRDACSSTRTISESRPSTPSSEPTKIVGTISYVIDDGIVMPSKMESSRVFVDQAIQVNILDGGTTRGHVVSTHATN